MQVSLAIKAHKRCILGNHEDNCSELLQNTTRVENPPKKNMPSKD